MRGVDAKFFEVLDCGRPKQVASHSRHHEDIRPAKTGSDRLIRPFAAEAKVELLAKDGFAGLGKAVRESCEIDVGAADHGDARTFGHSFLGSLRTPSLFGASGCVNEQPHMRPIPDFISDNTTQSRRSFLL